MKILIPMKHICAANLIAVLLLAAASSCNNNPGCAPAANGPAEVKDPLEVVRADRLRACGHEGRYRFEDCGKMTPAPKGYKAFYISHYGRHGSRYAWNPLTYTFVSEALDKAFEKGVLTQRGRQLYDQYKDFAAVPTIDYGQLTTLGWQQHEGIARQMYERFPEVFKGKGQVLARSSTSQRVILSMASFCVSLQKCNPELDIDCRSLATDLDVTKGISSKALSKWTAREKGLLESLESVDEVNARLIPTDEILSALFTDTSFFGSKKNRDQFAYRLYEIWCGYHNYTDSDFLEGIFTADQIAALWEAHNYNDWVAPVIEFGCDVEPLAYDIELRADEAIAGRCACCSAAGGCGEGAGCGGKAPAADLRFGHDFVVAQVARYLNLNGCYFAPACADEVKYGFQDYNIPMGSNLQLIFYRGKGGEADVIFKVLLNGTEATLPQLEAVGGIYYKWSDYKAWAASRRAGK